MFSVGLASPHLTKGVKRGGKLKARRTSGAAELTRRRKAGDEDAAVDPLTQPEIRQAVASASFEALVGFQLTEAQLKYNATR